MKGVISHKPPRMFEMGPMCHRFAVKAEPYLFALTVAVCFMFFCLVVWTERVVRSAGICVVSNHKIKGASHSETELWQPVT